MAGANPGCPTFNRLPVIGFAGNQLLSVLGSTDYLLPPPTGATPASDFHQGINKWVSYIPHSLVQRGGFEPPTFYLMVGALNTELPLRGLGERI